MISLQNLTKKKQHTRRVHQDSRHIQNPGTSETFEYSEPETYSEPWDVQNRRHAQNFVKHLRWSAQLTVIIIFTSYNYFCNISFSCPLVQELNMIILMQV